MLGVKIEDTFYTLGAKVYHEYYKFGYVYFGKFYAEIYTVYGFYVGDREGNQISEAGLTSEYILVDDDKFI